MLFIFALANIRYFTEGTPYALVQLCIFPIAMHAFAVPWSSIALLGLVAPIAFWYFASLTGSPAVLYAFLCLELVLLYATEWLNRKRFYTYYQLEIANRKTQQDLADVTNQLGSVQAQLDSSRLHSAELLKTHKNTLDVHSRMDDAYRYLTMQHTNQRLISQNPVFSMAVATVHEWVQHEKQEVARLYPDIEENHALFQPDELLKIIDIFKPWCAQRNIEISIRMDQSAQTMFMFGDAPKIKLAAQLLIWVALQQARVGKGNPKYPVYTPESCNEALSNGDGYDSEELELSKFDGRVVVTITNSGFAGVDKATLVEQKSSSSSTLTTGTGSASEGKYDSDSQPSSDILPLLFGSSGTRHSSSFGTLAPPLNSPVQSKTVVADVFWLRIEIEHTGPDVPTEVMAKRPPKDAQNFDKDGQKIKRKDLERKPLHHIRDDLPFCQAVDIKLASRLSKFSRGRINYRSRDDPQLQDVPKNLRIPEFRMGLMVKSIKQEDVSGNKTNANFQFSKGIAAIRP